MAATLSSFDKSGGRSSHASGHSPALEERSLNHGLQRLPSGLNCFPVARNSEHHRSINQSLPELWSDFSDRGLHGARAGDEKSATFHGDRQHASVSTAQSRNQVLFVGFVEFDMDGRHHTAGEMDRIMASKVLSKYPCARPATLDEYVDLKILGLPTHNKSGRDIVFVGPGATGCELFHTNTLHAQKCAVMPGDALDGSWGAASMFGRKSVLCVYSVERVKRQQSLCNFGLARSAIGKSGRLRRAGSLASIQDKTQWTCDAHGGSSPQAAKSIRSDQFFR